MCLKYHINPEVSITKSLCQRNQQHKKGRKNISPDKVALNKVISQMETISSISIVNKADTIFAFFPDEIPINTKAKHRNAPKNKKEGNTKRNWSKNDIDR